MTHLLRKFILFYISINLIFIFYNFALNYQKIFFPKINIFGEKNLIVLSLDGISGKEITNKILEDDEFRKELQDFKLKMISCLSISPLQDSFKQSLTIEATN